MFEFEVCEELGRPLLPLGFLDSGKGKGELYVLEDGEGGDEVEELEDESYVVEPEVG